MECPPASMMVYSDNETAAFAIDITLMVAEQQIIAPPPPPAELIKRERERLMLAELLKEQDNGDYNNRYTMSVYVRMILLLYRYY